jgi:hypothetical protein
MNGNGGILRWVRLFLGITFLVYGAIKLRGGQFVYADFRIDSRTTDGPTLVWCFFGYSPVYGRLVGLAECVPGLLLLFSRTRTLGAACLLPVTLNITVLDFCFRFTWVKYFSLVLTGLCLLLLAADYRKLWHLLREDRHPQPAAPAEDPPRAVRGRTGRLVAALAVLPAALFLLNVTGAPVLSTPVDAALAYCAGRGWPREDLTFTSWSGPARPSSFTAWAGFHREARVEFIREGPRPPARIQLTLHRPHSFAPWRITDCSLTEVGGAPGRRRPDEGCGSCQQD